MANESIIILFEGRKVRVCELFGFTGDIPYYTVDSVEERCRGAAV